MSKLKLRHYRANLFILFLISIIMIAVSCGEDFLGESTGESSSKDDSNTSGNLAGSNTSGIAPLDTSTTSSFEVTGVRASSAPIDESFEGRYVLQFKRDGGLAGGLFDRTKQYLISSTVLIVKGKGSIEVRSILDNATVLFRGSFEVHTDGAITSEVQAFLEGQPSAIGLIEVKNARANKEAKAIEGQYSFNSQQGSFTGTINGFELIEGQNPYDGAYQLELRPDIAQSSSFDPLSACAIVSGGFFSQPIGNNGIIIRGSIEAVDGSFSILSAKDSSQPLSGQGQVDSIGELSGTYTTGTQRGRIFGSRVNSCGSSVDGGTTASAPDTTGQTPNVDPIPDTSQRNYTLCHVEVDFSGGSLVGVALGIATTLFSGDKAYCTAGDCGFLNNTLGAFATEDGCMNECQRIVQVFDNYTQCQGLK